MKAKKLIEVALPIKEISAESVRDKSIRHGHISTLHLWWARRPLPVCRAIVFASLVPDPEDSLCPQAFRDAVKALLHPANDTITEMLYRPYADIPYTAVYDPMEDTLRNRLMMFIGKFSDTCQKNMLAGKSTSPKEQLAPGSLIKWENKNNETVLRIARELIFVAYNADRQPELGYETLHTRFCESFDAIKVAENALYSVVDRHIATAEVQLLEQTLQDAINGFQQQMPSVFDPFAGGGAIPLEAARLGCRSYGNDINPVAHVIEKASVVYPQRYGKPIFYSNEEFENRYGKDGIRMSQEKSRMVTHDANGYYIPNRLSWDVEYYSNIVIEKCKSLCHSLYTYDNEGKTPSVYQWMRFCQCSNCKREIPMFRQYYLSKPRSNKNQSRIKHYEVNIENDDIKIEVKNGDTVKTGNVNRGNVTCPYCGNITDLQSLKNQFLKKKISQKLVALVYDNGEKMFTSVPNDYKTPFIELDEHNIPQEKMQPNSAGGDVLSWGFTTWGSLFNDRQLQVLLTFVECINETYTNIDHNDDEYVKVIKVYLAILLDRIAVRMTSFGKWHNLQDTVEHLFGRQAIQMNYDYPEMNPFTPISNGAYGQLSSILDYINEEGIMSFRAEVQNISSGDKSAFSSKSITATVTDPPYYDAIAYADISDFFYVWLKRVLQNEFPLIFATPQTPKTEECTALKHHHGNNEREAEKFFENKLLQIFDAIEDQTTDMVSIMFAHQSTKAWTTLCNSILGAKMNITGSWPMDTEKQGALKTNMAYLESSVTVSCRPSERRGFGDYKEVKRDIEHKVTEEVESLYELGFRGADLLTACFGQAVSEFGRYKVVEKADGSEVTVAELLEMARTSAFDALLKGVQGDDYTRFYIGWLQLNGTGEVDFDDATKFTRVGVNVNINDIKQRGLLVLDGKKMHLALSEEHIGGSQVEGTRPTDSLIDQAHRAILFWKDGNRQRLLNFVRDCAKETNAPLWRLLATLKELLPAGDELKQVEGLLINAEDLRMNAGKILEHKQGDLFADL